VDPEPSSDDPRQTWERRYAQVREQGGSTLKYEPWLEHWQQLLPSGSRVLDLGCGAGHDAGWLSAAGYRVAAGDFSFAALTVAKEALAAPAFLQLDLRQGLPFAPRQFGGVVANLCLHYFPWPQTVTILEQIYACLKPGGALLARVNSTRDANFGAEGHPPVEPNAFLVNGMYKRYFDQENLEALFGSGWRMLGMEEMTIHRYGAPKVLWEVAAVKDGHF
jgi:SAM-dependent methyltransferase